MGLIWSSLAHLAQPCYLPRASARDSHPHRPLSHPTAAPDMWGSNASTAASESTDSLSPSPSQSAAVEFPLPVSSRPSPPSAAHPSQMSASSSSTSSQPLFDWPVSKPTSPRTRTDPFDTFDPVSSSSEDDPVPQETRRAGHHRSVTDPLLRDGQPLDMEIHYCRTACTGLRL